MIWIAFSGTKLKTLLANAHIVDGFINIATLLIKTQRTVAVLPVDSDVGAAFQMLKVALCASLFLV
jgi:hypothetical protein